MLRKRLRQLDAARTFDGQQPWSADPDVRRLLRGLHHERPLRIGARGQPLYRELTSALVDEVMCPTHDQRRWRTALLLANETGASSRALTVLQWSDVRFRTDRVTIHWRILDHSRMDKESVVRREQAERTFEAMRDLWARAPDRSQPVFASERGASDYQRMWTVCRALPPYNHALGRRPRTSPDDLDALIRSTTEPSSEQLRDRALILIGFAAALRTGEASIARIGWFQEDSDGLLLDLPRRREVTTIPRGQGADCPVAAWRSWLARMRRQGAGSPADVAFPLLRGSVILRRPLGPAGLNRIVSDRAAAAGLQEGFKFTNLRDGWMRDAIRAGISTAQIAAHADLRSMNSVAVHEGRENLLKHNVASRLGL
ncbi:hypothetical protein KMZ32_17960 [Phycicoccus sp. MAQZ13P-2]|uniref:hypothetical protein n=1 Tax=Phycicoccus mangrovi TaxID=2840470 RepID=UPI001BFFE04C|nr:hypothetical protein [Phycicoccus mangrovi]MBT9275964.1 hypothetical protein [Phycicoccus mangrovi]